MSIKDRIELEHFYTFSPSVIWRALTDPALHARWWAAGDVRPVVGHQFELDMGKWGRQACEVLEMKHERLLKYRFAKGVLDTIITWQLIPEGTGTRLRLTQEGFDLASPLGRQALEGMSGGWPKRLAKLGEVVDGQLKMSVGKQDAEAP